MSAILEKYLYDIDQSFAQKSDKDIKMIYAMVFVVLVTFSYLVFWESSEQGYKDALAASQAVQAKIDTDRQYLLMHPESEIVRLDQEITQLNNELVSLKSENAYIKTEIEKIPELFYDEEIWGEFIDSIAENAKKHKVKLNYFANRLAEDKTKFGHVLNIDIQAIGQYQDMIRFINAIEKSKLVVDLHDLNLEATTKLNLDLNLSVWGITY
ncbi:type 4a pilus biogenesis protein PilO [Sulfurimonas sp. HSL3-7]|uniref:type 4a pilus biogenesis protein PilO n=1 Tax=Sulfonitrofixus jiaomeiensis TaxID=3131938 RepID=UPI0031F947F3